MPVVTIRGQMGSGAPETGKIIADKLGIDYLDREIIAGVAGKLKWPSQGVASKEAPPGTFLGRIAEALGRSYPLDVGYSSASLPVYEIPLDDTHYLAGLESVIKELASSQSVVIRGRGSQFILKDWPDALHILLVAREETRLKRMVDSLKIPESDARKELSRSDSSHREFIKRYFKSDLEDPINYDIVINTDILTFEDASAIAIKALQAKQKQ